MKFVPTNCSPKSSFSKCTPLAVGTGGAATTPRACNSAAELSGSNTATSSHHTTPAAFCCG